MNHNHIKMYQDVGNYSHILGASPYQQIEILFEKALKDIRLAIKGMQENKPNIKGIGIVSADNIVCYLRECLNLEQGGELALKLDKIYAHLTQELFFANAENNPQKLEACLLILTNLKTWWEKVDAK